MAQARVQTDVARGVIRVLEELGFIQGLDGYSLDLRENEFYEPQRKLVLGKLTIYLDVKKIIKPTAIFDEEDPTVIDVIAYAVWAGKPRILVMLAKLLGAYVDTHLTGDPCSSQWSQRLADDDNDTIEFVEKIMIWERVRRKRLYQGADTDRYRLYFAMDKKGRWYLVYEEENSGWTPSTDWYNYNAWVLPLQPMRLRKVEGGVSVRCGSDGDAREYGPKVVREYVFPPEMYEH